MITVVNKHHHEPTDIDIYVGRGSPLGNPYRIGINVDRNEAISNYREYIAIKIKNKDSSICTELNKIWSMAKKGDVNLVCFCKPDACHGDLIKQIIEEKL